MVSPCLLSDHCLGTAFVVLTLHACPSSLYRGGASLRYPSLIQGGNICVFQTIPSPADLVVPAEGALIRSKQPTVQRIWLCPRQFLAGVMRCQLPGVPLGSLRSSRDILKVHKNDLFRCIFLPFSFVTTYLKI